LNKKELEKLKNLFLEFCTLEILLTKLQYLELKVNHHLGGFLILNNVSFLAGIYFCFYLEF
jgi:hypothetical protein